MYFPFKLITVHHSVGQRGHFMQLTDHGALADWSSGDLSSLLRLFMLFLLLPGWLLPAPIDAQSAQTPSAVAERTKIAEGEYAIYEEANGGAFGPLGEEVYDFHESWTLWGTEKKQYTVEGERDFESPKFTVHKDRFQVELSRDLTVMRLTEFAQQRGIREVGPVRCEFMLKQLQCFSGGQSLQIPMEHPYALLWPVSPFSLSGLIRESERDAARDTKVQLLSIEQPYATLPVQPMVLSGDLQYMGEENVEAAGQTWRGYKFSLKVAMHPQILLWTSTKGLLLALAIEHPHPNWPKEGMRLIRYRKWADF
jgi:hypothetical protein